MVQFEELRLYLLSFEEKLAELGEALGLKEMKAEVVSLEEKTAQDGFWDDIANTQVVLQKIKNKKGIPNWECLNFLSCFIYQPVLNT